MGPTQHDEGMGRAARAPRIAIVSSSDARYFTLLSELVASIRRLRPADGVGICVMDAGMTDEQRAALSGSVDRIHRCEWPFPLPERRIRGRDSLKANLCRPFIPDYFPGFDVFVWLDADTWVADWGAIELYVRGAERMAISIAAQTDRAYPPPVSVSWLLGRPFRIKTFYYSNAKRAFGRVLARDMVRRNVLNAGAFGLHRDAPHWWVWRRLMGEALRRGRPFTADQLTLGMLVYQEGAAVEILPAWCNWLVDLAPPAWDPAAGRFVEPYLPHAPIGVMHLAGVPRMRADRGETVPVPGVDGVARQMSLRFPGGGDAGA